MCRPRRPVHDSDKPDDLWAYLRGFPVMPCWLILEGLVHAGGESSQQLAVPLSRGVIAFALNRDRPMCVSRGNFFDVQL